MQKEKEVVCEDYLLLFVSTPISRLLILLNKNLTGNSSTIRKLQHDYNF